MTDETKDAGTSWRLTRENKDAIAAKLLQGASPAALAAEYGVSRQAIHKMKDKLQADGGTTPRPAVHPILANKVRKWGLRWLLDPTNPVDDAGQKLRDELLKYIRDTVA